MALAAAVLVVAVVVSQLAPSNPGNSRVIRAQVTGRGNAELRLASGHGELILHHFAPPPPGQIYEVWVKRAGQPPAPTSALFSVTAAGDGAVVVPGDLRRVGLIMVTPEPDGGTRVPTHPPVLSVALS